MPFAASRVSWLRIEGEKLSSAELPSRLANGAIIRQKDFELPSVWDSPLSGIFSKVTLGLGRS